MRERWFAYGRQRLNRAGGDAASVLRDIIATYSAQPSAALTLHARVPGLTGDAVRALQDERDAIRIPGPRASIHLIPRETAARVHRACRPPEKIIDRSVRYYGIDEATFARAAAEVLELAREPVTTAQMAEATGIERSNATAGNLARRGQLIRLAPKSLRSNAVRYVSVEAWLGAPLDDVAVDEAKAWLAGAYLRAFGPARVKDVAWWMGGPAAKAVKAVDTIDVGDGLLLRRQDEAEYEAAGPPRSGTIDLVPKWDMWMMGYAGDGRGRLVAPELQDRIYDHRGDGIATLLVDGQAAGTWSATKGEPPRVEPFEPLPAKTAKKVAERLAEVAAFLA